MAMDFVMQEMPTYQGMVNHHWVDAARQNASFLNEHGMMMSGMRDMLKADLKATVDYAEKNVNRAVAARIIDEGRRLFGDEVNLW